LQDRPHLKTALVQLLGSRRAEIHDRAVTQYAGFGFGHENSSRITVAVRKRRDGQRFSTSGWRAFLPFGKKISSRSLLPVDNDRGGA
jgi:hypothetical protein